MRRRIIIIIALSLFYAVRTFLTIFFPRDIYIYFLNIFIFYYIFKHTTAETWHTLVYWYKTYDTKQHKSSRQKLNMYDYARMEKLQINKIAKLRIFLVHTFK